LKNYVLGTEPLFSCHIKSLAHYSLRGLKRREHDITFNSEAYVSPYHCE